MNGFNYKHFLAGSVLGSAVGVGIGLYAFPDGKVKPVSSIKRTTKRKKMPIKKIATTTPKGHSPTLKKRSKV